MTYPTDYWGEYECEAKTLQEYIKVIEDLQNTWPKLRFIWRGVRDADYALHSTLYRLALIESGSTDLNELKLRPVEDRVVKNARTWSLQRTATDRLSALELLAALQHQRVPTRLLDFTHNALVALWFAVEHRRERNGEPDDIDGRVFVARYDGREVTEIVPQWEWEPILPWSGIRPSDWLRDILVWTPPPIDPRMTRQQGCFVFGGVPTTESSWRMPGRQPDETMRAEEIRKCFSVPIRLNNPDYIKHRRLKGKPARYPLAFTLRIPAQSKELLRAQLQHGFGYTHAMMFPDYPGFAQYGEDIPRDPTCSASSHLTSTQRTNG